VAEPWIRLHRDDDVIVATRDVAASTRVEVDDVTAVTTSAVPAGHKIAIRAIRVGEQVHKYGQPIGAASAPIAVGDHVHTHNLAFRPVDQDYAFGTGRRAPAARPPERTFQGIVRPDGRVATRNYVGVVTSVNCSATVARRIAAELNSPGALDEFPSVDGVVAVTHGQGCGLAGSGEGFDLLRRTLIGYADHPNMAAVIVLGLGCEVNQSGALVTELDGTRPVHHMTIQDEGGSQRTVRAAVAKIRELLRDSPPPDRQPVPLSELVLGTNCGGSDAFSGITANPALGAAADLLVAHGGTVVLAETPEIYGAEHLLTRRAVTAEVGEKLLERIRWWESYTARHGGSMDNNPAPGNKAGGITTILEKSLGAVAKGGTTDLCDVVAYAERITSKGFVFMDTPGYDPVSVTGIVAGGANVVCFTTGRGSVFGCKPVPSLKLATTSALYQRMEDDMDVDCGVILTGGLSVEECGAVILDLVVKTASGERTKSELFGFGDDEILPWQLGEVM
jgi:altronate hydrolase